VVNVTSSLVSKTIPLTLKPRFSVTEPIKLMIRLTSLVAKEVVTEASEILI
jgi:hypothetical protein